MTRVGLEISMLCWSTGISPAAGGTTTVWPSVEIVSTPLQARDDAEYPAFHRVLFDVGLGASDLLPQPVLIGERLLVGRVREIVPAGRARF